MSGDWDSRWVTYGCTELAAAADAFSVATVAHANAIKNEAKAEAEIIAAVVDVATGFLAPVFANRAARAGFMVRRQAPRGAFRL